MGEFTGKVAFITGAAHGQGRATALAPVDLRKRFTEAAEGVREGAVDGDGPGQNDCGWH